VAVLPDTLNLPDSEHVLFVTPSDLTSRGALGHARLVVTDTSVYRYEKTPLGEEIIASWPVAELSDPQVETLVDASAIVAKLNGKRVELLRGTSSKSLLLAGAQKRLEALVNGDEIPQFPDEFRVCSRCGRPLPEDSDICLGCVSKGRTLLRLFEFTRPYKGRLIWGTCLILLGTLFEVAPPYLTKLLVDDVLTEGRTEIFGWLILGIVGARLGIMFVQMARGRNVAYLSSRVAVDIRSKLFHKLQQLSLGFYDRRNVGSIMSRVTNDTGALYDVLVDGVPVVVNQGALLIGIPVAMLLINWEIAIWALLPVPFVLLAVNIFRRNMMKVWSRFWHNWARMSGALNGVLQGTRVVKAFHGERREEESFGRRIRELANVGYIAERNWSTFFPIVVFTMSISTFIVWWVGGNAVLNGRMTIGELTAFVGYLVMLSQPLMMLQRVIDWTSRSLTAAERVFEIMDTPADIEDHPDAVDMPDMKGAVRFKDIHFGYEKAREVLHGINLEVAPGEMIGLVGPSGAGKSTLINMLMRFYDPTRGSIEIDDVDLRRIKLDDFRRQVGVVLQESYLFPGSVRGNIAYGRQDATLEEIMEAAKAANAHDFIVNFPDGYDTYVGERGQRLSGGERQRIAIARAILHNPKILILDEATASVDTETERMIQEALGRLVEGRTVFAIAHRLSTLRDADRLVVIDDGKVAEVGTHEELINKEQGIYAKLVAMQQEIGKIHENFLFGPEPDNGD
jgi:ATP-binding cassette, subfamily B, bacterial